MRGIAWWIGVTAEDQRRADERIPLLLAPQLLPTLCLFLSRPSRRLDRSTGGSRVRGSIDCVGGEPRLIAAYCPVPFAGSMSAAMGPRAAARSAWGRLPIAQARRGAWQLFFKQVAGTRARELAAPAVDTVFTVWPMNTARAPDWGVAKTPTVPVSLARNNNEVNTTEIQKRLTASGTCGLGTFKRQSKIRTVTRLVFKVPSLEAATSHTEDGQYRPSDNSMMNSLFGLSADTSFDSVSREQMVLPIWQFVRPIDSTVPAQGVVSGPGNLQVNVIDPLVINVDWSVDGELVAENAGTTFDTGVLTPG